MIKLDKIRGMFAGVFLGDTLGAPHEFKCNAKIIYTGKLEYRPFHTSRFQGKKELEIGQVTDDSEMTLALLRCILKDQTYIEDNVILAYLNWANSGVWTMGKNTRALFKGVITVKGYRNRIQKLTTISQSNGTLMRCTSLALLFNNDFVIADVNLSNPDSVVRDSELVYVTALRLAIQGYPNIFSYVKNLSQTPEVKEVIKQVENKQHRDIVTNKGWCLHALYCALWVIENFTSFTKAMDWIMSFKGSDTDTNGAIAGALLAASFGFYQIMSEEITKNNFEIILNCKVDLGPTIRQKEYGISDFYDFTLSAYKLSLKEYK